MDWMTKLFPASQPPQKSGATGGNKIVWTPRAHPWLKEEATRLKAVGRWFGVSDVSPPFPFSSSAPSLHKLTSEILSSNPSGKAAISARRRAVRAVRAVNLERLNPCSCQMMSSPCPLSTSSRRWLVLHVSRPCPWIHICQGHCKGHSARLRGRYLIYV
ncbi:hypothetical protein BP00DRAFT_430437, partial [Aspergillus indologenus CBS 114.80]